MAHVVRSDGWSLNCHPMATHVSSGVGVENEASAPDLRDFQRDDSWCQTCFPCRPHDEVVNNPVLRSAEWCQALKKRGGHWRWAHSQLNMVSSVLDLSEYSHESGRIGSSINLLRF